MSGLSHYLEEAGIATTGISLVREHSEQLRPPRALWVPFPLGRPLGVPGGTVGGDSSSEQFQTQVLRATLALLSRNDGPVILEDFPDDAPSDVQKVDQADWVCPVSFPNQRSEQELLEQVLDEIGKLAPWHEVSTRERGRTTVGLCGLDIQDAARFVGRFLPDAPLPADGVPESPNPDLSPGRALKMSLEDLKAFYYESAQARPDGASRQRLTTWLWQETALGDLMRAIEPVCQRSPDPDISYLGKSALVPREHQRGPT